MRLTVNSQESLSRAIGEIREIWRARKYIQVNIIEGKSRSISQNSISHAWYEQVARELREDDARGVKRYCKLHFGVPLLRAEDDEFREAYDGSILRTLSYEQKLLAMDVLPVTSRMTTAQLSRYMEDVQKHYRGRVALEFPVEHARAA
jgi:hypothetical protein